MKIGILTFHQALNYGAVLQAYALQKFVKNNFQNCEIELIDYRCPYLSQIYSSKARKDKNIILQCIKKIHFSFKKGLFCFFIKKNIRLSRPYFCDTIMTANEIYDKFIVGSDQVWNYKLTNLDLNFFLSFANPYKRYSYAASIGITEIPNNIKKVYLSELQLFQKISVREQQAIETIRLLGEEAKSLQIRQHIDPVFLLTAAEWMGLCSNFRNQQKKYVLVFSVDYSQELIEEAVEFAHKKNLPVLYVGQYTKNPYVKYLPLLSVKKMLALFRDASYTFVNSFHGTAFSILFHKMFYSRMSHSDGRNCRIINLLQTTSLMNRTRVDHIDSTVDWTYVDCKLENEREKSKAYLSEIVSNEN